MIDENFVNAAVRIRREYLKVNSNLDYIKETYGWKIPYPEKNYVKYFDSFTQEVLEDWGLV